MDRQDTATASGFGLEWQASRNGALQLLCLVRGLLCALIVLCLPPGVGVMLLALAAASVWRLESLVSRLLRLTA